MVLPGPHVLQTGEQSSQSGMCLNAVRERQNAMQAQRREREVPAGRSVSGNAFGGGSI